MDSTDQRVRDYDYSLHYRTWHDESEEHTRRTIDFHRLQLAPYLPPPTTSAALDVGCGMGFAMMTLHQLGFRDVKGIDVDPQQVDSCRRRGLAVERVEDAHAYLSRQERAFDLILMLDFLEHVPVDEHVALMRAARFALTDQGRVILTVPNASSVISARWRYIDHTHYTSFTEHSLRFVLLNAGYEHVLLPKEPWPSRPPLRLWKASSRVWFRKWLVRYLWRQVLKAEVIDTPDVDEISLSLNLFAVAWNTKAGHPVR